MGFRFGGRLDASLALRAFASTMFTRVAILMLVLCTAPVAAAHQSLPPEPPTIAAVRVEQPPVLDGEVLDDPVWAAAVPVEGFWQTTPVEGAPSSERTEVRIVYTDVALYVGIICYDRNPEQIIVADARRDAPLDNTDSVRVILDTYQDRRSGFVFGTNPAGLEYDGQVINEGQGGGFGTGSAFNLNWDGSWRVRASISRIGWSAEFEIPFRTLRYPSAEIQSWGINVERRIRRRNEVAYWAPVPRQFDLFRLSLAGTLTGLQVASQRNLKLVPYVLGRARNERFNPGDPSMHGDLGSDLKYSLTPSLTLDATWNTDFAQVEVDEQQINLDRFNLFFPEKRPFFLENAGLFAVGSAAEAEVFFTRRIGLSPGGEPIPILGGGRLSGQVRPGLHLGLLNMQTESAAGLPGNNFAVARLRQDFRNRSSAGAIVVNRQATGSLAGDDNHNRSLAVDGRLGVGRTGLLSAFAARTGTPGRSGDEHAWQLSARRDTQAWELSASFTEVGRNFNPEVGFLSRTGGFRKPEFLIFHRYRPGSFLRLHEIRPHVSYRGFWKPDGFLESSFLHLDSHWEWRSGHEIHTGLNFTREGVRTPFRIAGVLVPPGVYEHKEAQIIGFTNTGARWGYNLRAVIGGFFGGDRVALNQSVRFRFSEAFNTELTWSRNDVDLPTGSFTTNLVRHRVSYSFSPRVFVQGLLQYNDAADVWSANIRFGLLQQANTGLFIVYNDTQYFDDVLLPPAGERLTTGRSLVVKVSRMFDILR